MQRSTKLALAVVLAIVGTIATVWMVAQPEPPDGLDRNVPSATTGPGRNSTSQR